MSEQIRNIGCPLCGEPLRFSIAASRRAKKPKSFVMLTCPTDGRHFRAFISDQAYVQSVLGAIGPTGTHEGRTPAGAADLTTTEKQGAR